MITLENGKPLLSVWFGNFYEPAYSDPAFVEDTMRLIASLGFTAVELDAKAWRDFDERFAGGEASRYVAGQELMMESAARNGLSHIFLALYLNGDNLYPNIRFSPPIYGESVTDAQGRDGRWYKYWSNKARDAMLRHVRGLFSLYRKNMASLVLPDHRQAYALCSMWDPIVAPSFDKEGRERYLQWLQTRYGCIEQLNAAYGAAFSNFDEIRKEDYWFQCRYPGQTCYTLADRRKNTPAYHLWCDNKKWQRFEIRAYFSEMRARFSQLNVPLYLSPDLAQWGYYLNVDGNQLSGVGFADLWDTAMRGLDLFELSSAVDNCQFISVPVTPDGSPDPYVLACHHSMMRAMNPGRDFMGGVFWGRFLYNDLYRVLTPCELVGSIAASGACGIWSYGINGLDDGGLLHRMGDGFLRSLQTANEWFQRVLPLLGKRIASEVAILFPNATSAFEPLVVQGAAERRLDLLGYYKACCDAGCSPDIVDIGMVASGALALYRMLIIPSNPCYAEERNLKAEAELLRFAENGGILLHGPSNPLVDAIWPSDEQPHDADGFVYGERLLTGNLPCAAFTDGVPLARYISDSAICARYVGTRYSIGFDFGTAVIAKVAPHVPAIHRNMDLYPVSMARRRFLADLLARAGVALEPSFGCDIEVARFENGLLLVNHSAYPLPLPGDKGEFFFQMGQDGSVLQARSAVFILTATAGSTPLR